MKPVFVLCTASAVPRVRLPVKLDIVKHAREVDGKSTAVHAPIIGTFLFVLIILTKERFDIKYV